MDNTDVVRWQQVSGSGAAILVGLLSAFSSYPALGNEPPTATPGSASAKSSPPPDQTGYYAVDVSSEIDPGGQHLTGLRFSAGAVGDRGSENDGHAETSVAFLTGDGQQVYRASLGTALTLFTIKELLVAPRFGLGVEYRRSEPDPGWAGIFALGVELSSWIKKKVELALFVDRNFGFPSGTRNQFGIAVRWGAKRLPWWPKQKQTPAPEGPHH